MLITMDVGSSSMVDLKAELVRRKNNLRTTQQHTSRADYSYSKSNAKKPFLLTSKEIAAKSEKSAERMKKINRLEQELAREQQDIDFARKRLEEKAALYSQYESGGVRDSVTKSVLLVDFDKKIEGKDADERETETTVREGSLDHANDAETFESAASAIVSPENQELVSSDMLRAAERERWEASMLEASTSGGQPEMDGPVHYQHALRDEKWEHGVGYFQFSKDEQERAKQMEFLKSMRAQNEMQRKQVDVIKSKKEALIEARLAKIRQRRNIVKKENDAAPAIDPAILNIPLPEGSDPEEVRQRQEAEEKTRLAREAELKRLSHIRPWDREKKNPMTQDEWIAKKRKERDDNFAPPSFAYS